MSSYGTTPAAPAVSAADPALAPTATSPPPPPASTAATAGSTAPPSIASTADVGTPGTAPSVLSTDPSAADFSTAANPAPDASASTSATATANTSDQTTPAGTTDNNSDAAIAASLQGEALAHAQRMQEHRLLEQEHPHMSMMAGYLKNFATTINPKANTAAVPSYAAGPKPAPTQTSTASAPTAAGAPASAPALPPRPDAAPQKSGPVFDAAALPATGGFAAAPKSNPAAAAEPQGAFNASAPLTAPQRGAEAAASAIEEIQSGMEALVSAHLNKSRAIAGLPLLPVLLNGPADGLPPITYLASLEEMDDKGLAAWAAYYLGDTSNLTLDRATMLRAVKAGLGVLDV